MPSPPRLRRSFFVRSVHEVAPDAAARAKALASQLAELSPVVCWTRMQAEAGQPIEAIIARKELERKAGDGLFCWGIGSAPPRSLGEVSRGGREIDVVFSLMKSRPKPADVTPAGLVVWRSYIDTEGRER